MKNILYYFITTALIIGWILLGSTKLNAQEDMQVVKSFLSKAQHAYQQSSYLSFDLKYFYTNAGATTGAMDSLSGQMQMDKGRCRLLLGRTETVTTGRYIIQIMPEDKSIYLSGARTASFADPLQIIDSMFLRMKDVRGSVSNEASSGVLTIQFPPGNMYSRIRMEMDLATGLFRRVNYRLRTESLVGKDLIESPGHPAPYQPEGEVDMIFNHYENGRFADSLFDEQNFFTRISIGKFEPSARYRDYQIFLASSNL